MRTAEQEGKRRKQGKNRKGREERVINKRGKWEKECKEKEL